MGLDWTAGLLGAAAGGANAVDKLSEERRRELAEQLKREALEAIAVRSDERRHGYDKSLQKTDIESSEKIAGERNDTSREIAGEHDATSREIAQTRQNNAYNIAEARNTVLKDLEAMRQETDKLKLGSTEENTNARMVQARTAAFKEVGNIVERGGSLDEINSLLSPFNVMYKMGVIKKGTEGGWLQNGSIYDKGEPDVTGLVLVTTDGKPVGGTEGGAPQTGLSPFLSDLIGDPGGETGIMSDEPGTAQAAESAPPKEAQSRSPVSTETAAPERKGLLETGGPAPKGLPEDMADWDVTTKTVNGKKVPVVITDSGPVELTQEEYELWKKWQAGQEPSGVTALKNARNINETPNPGPRPF